MRTTLLLLLLTLSAGLFAQKTVVYGEYWFDGSYNTPHALTIEAGETVNLTEQIDVSHLEAGLHSVHIRLMDQAGLWSAAESGYFIIRTGTVSQEVAAVSTVKYWLDNNYAGFIETDIPDASVISFTPQFDAASLSPGLHTIAFLFADDAGRHSSPVTSFLSSHLFHWLMREEECKD